MRYLPSFRFIIRSKGMNPNPFLNDNWPRELVNENMCKSLFHMEFTTWEVR